jgi:ribosome biogenesis protein UTP30
MSEIFEQPALQHSSHRQQANMAKKSAAPRPPSTPLRPAPPADFNKAQATVSRCCPHAAKVQKEREETELERDEHVWLSINTKTGSTRKKLMPVKM